MRNIILSPHYDDAVFSCFHLLNNPDTLVINIFSGIPKKNHRTLWDYLCGEGDSRKMMEKRRKENEKILNKLKCHYLDLDFLDNQYQKDKDIDTIYLSISKVLKNGDQIYAPSASSKIYKHPDHLITNKIAKILAEKEYKVVYYSDLPYMKVDHRNGNIKLNKEQIKEKSNLSKLYKTQYRMTNITSLGILNSSIKSGFEKIFF